MVCQYFMHVIKHTKVGIKNKCINIFPQSLKNFFQLPYFGDSGFRWKCKEHRERVPNLPRETKWRFRKGSREGMSQKRLSGGK